MAEVTIYSTPTCGYCTMAKDFLQETGSIPAAIEAFISAVKNGTFPGPEQTFE